MTDPALWGVPLVPSPYVKPGTILMVDGRIVYFSRPSRREKWRHPHGRSRGRRRRIVTIVRYEPEMARIRELMIKRS